MIRKRLYLGLLAGTMLFLSGMLVYIWLSFFRQDTGALRYLLFVIVMLILAGLTIVVIGFLGIIFSLLAEKDLAILHKPMNYTFSLLYPIVIWLGKVLKIAQDRIQCSFVEVNNQLVRAQRSKIKPEKLLVLLPHCLQTAECTKRITIRTENCVRCGNCPVGGILDLCDYYGVHVKIATGGTIARDAVKKLKPQAIVAVACERDLTSGILDCIPLPVLGVPNTKPNGPCFNTLVNLTDVEKAILFFVAEAV